MPSKPLVLIASTPWPESRPRRPSCVLPYPASAHLQKAQEGRGRREPPLDGCFVPWASDSAGPTPGEEQEQVWRTA